MEFIIAQEKDIEEILQIYNEVKGSPFCSWNDKYPTIFEVKEDIKRKDLFILKNQNIIIGAVSFVHPLELNDFTCWKEKENITEVARLVIKKEYQGKGFSKIILQNIILEAKKRNVSSIHLSVVKSNTPTLKLYKSSSFSFLQEVNLYENQYYLCELVLEKIKIEELDVNIYKGKKFIVQYETPGYYDLIRNGLSFSFVYKESAKKEKRGFEDKIGDPWLTNPHLFGAFINDELVGFIETSEETWNNRLRISNIFIDENHRHHGLGTMLINKVKEYARINKYRQIILETQSCNVNAIKFYMKNQFILIGLDSHSYSNVDIDKHEVRMEFGYEIK